MDTKRYLIRDANHIVDPFEIWSATYYPLGELFRERSHLEIKTGVNITMKLSNEVADTVWKHLCRIVVNIDADDDLCTCIDDGHSPLCPSCKRWLASKHNSDDDLPF
jgi:hypothetical protein